MTGNTVKLEEIRDIIDNLCKTMPSEIREWLGNRYETVPADLVPMLDNMVGDMRSVRNVACVDDTGDNAADLHMKLIDVANQLADAMNEAGTKTIIELNRRNRATYHVEGLVRGLAKTACHIAKGDTYRGETIAVVTWSREDLRTWLEDHDLPVTDRNMDYMRGNLGWLEEGSIEHGWNIINDSINMDNLPDQNKD